MSVCNPVRQIVAALCLSSLVGCGVSETAATAGAAAQAKAKEAEQGNRTKNHVQTEIQKAEEERRKRLQAAEGGTVPY